MGFGSLFIGYFFLINISYFTYTDIISAMVMLLALYKLSPINREFRCAMVFSGIFSAFSLFELATTVIEMFMPSGFGGTILRYITIPRYILIFALTFTILSGIEKVAREVDASTLAIRARRSIPLSALYLILAVFDIPELSATLGAIAPYIYIVLLLFTVIIVLFNLSTIYKAYMQICMPEDNIPRAENPSGGTSSRFREREMNNAKKYAEYKLQSEYQKNLKKKDKLDKKSKNKKS